MTRADHTQHAPGPILVTIDPHARMQRFEGWGTSLAWWGHLLGSSFPHRREAFARDLFGLDDGGLGMTVVRYNIGGGENPGFEPTMELRARVPGWKERPGGPWLPEADAGQLGVLQDALGQMAVAGEQAHLETFANSPPWWMTVSGTVTGNLGPTGLPSDNLREDAVEEFADYIAQVSGFVRERVSADVETISPVNEPSSRWWRPGGRQEGSAYSRPMMARVVAALDDAIVRCDACGEAGIAVAEEWELADSIRTWDSFDSSTRARVRAFNAHTYHGVERSALRARIEASGLPLIVSEYGDGDPTGLATARTILRDLRELRTPRWVTWQAVGPDAWGFWLLSSDGTPRRLRKRAAFAQFSRFIRPGWVLVGADSPDVVAAIAPDADELVLVAVNDSSSPLEFGFDLDAFVSVSDGVRFDTDCVKGPGRELAPRDVDVRAGMLSVDVAPTSVCSIRLGCRVDSPADARFARSGRVRLVTHDGGVDRALSTTGPVDRFDPGGEVVATALDHGDPRQMWDVQACAEGTVRFVSAANGHQLDVARDHRDAGAGVITWWARTERSTPGNARWSVVRAASGTWRIHGAASGRDLVVAMSGPHGPHAPTPAVLGERVDARCAWSIELVEASGRRL